MQPPAPWHAFTQRCLSSLCWQVMEAREQVEETDDESELRLLLEANQLQQQQVIQRLGKVFAEPGAERQAAELAGRLAYLARLESEIVQRLPDSKGASGNASAFTD
eukprot:355645-Chlamydomonas_euryale.AAC.2